MEQSIQSIGSVPWSRETIRASIPDFLNLYQSRPISINQGGMRAPHMFATWFLLKELQPRVLIESGVWKGQGTWLMHKTLPEAQIYAFDPLPEQRIYHCPKAQYFTQDVQEMDWAFLSEKANALLFFDDHQNALERIRWGKAAGFRQFIFEDNYPSSQGDCYSIKQAFQQAGFKPPTSNKSFLGKMKDYFWGNKKTLIPPGKADAEYLQQVLTTYYEFPPVFQSKKTRWGDEWSAEKYPGPQPLFSLSEAEERNLFLEEAEFYTWLCLAIL